MGLLIFLFVGLHEYGLFNLVNFQAPLLCGLGPKLQSPMILTPLPVSDTCRTTQTSVPKKLFFLLLQHTLALLGHISDKSMIRELKICRNNDDRGVVKERSRLLESNLELKQIKGSFILSFSIRIQFPLLS